MMTLQVPWFHRQFVLAWLCALLAVVADWLFYQRPIGWTLGLFGAATAAAIALRHPRLWRKMEGRIALGLTLGMLMAPVEEPSPLAVTMSVVCLGMLVSIGQEGWTSRLLEWAGRAFHLMAKVPLQAFLDQRKAARWLRVHPASRPRYMRFVGRWVLPLMAGSVFVGLFVMANPILERWLRQAFDEVITLFDWLPMFLGVGRVTLWVGVGVIAYGLMRYRRAGRRRATGAVAIPPVLIAESVLPGVMLIVRCLVVFNAVFAVQTVLDLVYLYGGATLPAGMTYAHYAHRGAYPLVATALLAGAFVLLTFRTGGASHRSLLARRLVYLWIAQNMLLLVSTVWRIWLYVHVYSLTYWRLSAMIWISLVGAGFAWMVWKIVAGRSNAWLWRVNVGTAFAVLYACAFINFAGLIAEFNVRHCREVDGTGAPLDVGYLAKLGPQAIPALEWVHPRLALSERPRVVYVEQQLAARLQSQLSDWRGWTYRRQRVAVQAGTESVARAW